MNVLCDRTELPQSGDCQGSNDAGEKKAGRRLRMEHVYKLIILIEHNAMLDADLAPYSNYSKVLSP